MHLDAAYTLARYLTRRGDQADDIVQEALLRAYRSFESQRGENSRAWLLAIVRNCFLTWQASGSRVLHLSLEEDHELSSVASGTAADQETPESILIQHQENSAVRALIEGLPQNFREVLVLRDIEDMSYRDIGEIINAPIGTVMSRLARARKMLAAAWQGPDLNPSKEVRS